MGQGRMGPNEWLDRLGGEQDTESFSINDCLVEVVVAINIVVSLWFFLLLVLLLSVETGVLVLVDQSLLDPALVMDRVVFVFFSLFGSHERRKGEGFGLGELDVIAGSGFVVGDR